MIKDSYQGVASYLCYYYILKGHLEQLSLISLPLRIYSLPGYLITPQSLKLASARVKCRITLLGNDLKAAIGCRSRIPLILIGKAPHKFLLSRKTTAKQLLQGQHFHHRVAYSQNSIVD